MVKHADQGDGAPGAGERGMTRREHPLRQEEAREDLGERLDRVTRVTLRPVASPLPAGFVALATATLMVAGLNLGWIPSSETRNVAFALLAMVGPLQFTAAIFGLLARDGVAATAMAILAGTWITVGLVMATSAPGSTSDALGLLFLTSAVAMLLPAAGAALAKLVPALVFFATSLRFASAGVYELTGSTTWEAVTGWIGVVLCGLALYAALASLLEGAQGRTVLPLGRRQRGRIAVEGGYSEQTLGVVHEPGVRLQL
jgi:uncharacterized protein